MNFPLVYVFILQVSNTIVFRNKYILYEYVAEDGHFLDIYWACCLYSSPRRPIHL